MDGIFSFLRLAPGLKRAFLSLQLLDLDNEAGAYLPCALLDA
jgi:hypothetical protein